MTKSSASNSFAVARSLGSILRQRPMKAFADEERLSGQGGGSLLVAIWKSAVRLLENFGQG